MPSTPISTPSSSPSSASTTPTSCDAAAEEQSDHLSVLERLIEGEANLRRDRSIERRIRLARFPVKKTLDSFDWSWPNKINRLQVQNLFRLRFLDDATNVVLVGSVGLGKSHLVTALGLQACERGHSVLFTSAIDAVNTLAAAKAAGQLKLVFDSVCGYTEAQI